LRNVFARRNVVERVSEIDVITGRPLLREEIKEVWAIDRSEVIDHVYYFERGTLVLKPEHSDVDGWPPGEAEKYTPLLIDCFARGGWFYGLFDEAKLIGVAVLDGRFIGRKKNQLQLKFLYVSRTYRQQGLGQRLFALAKAEACARGAKRLYISATPSENTVDFYRRLGCVVTREMDPELFALEPKDIHLECDV
jgi:predicted N-acetyltransferase YhbS